MQRTFLLVVWLFLVGATWGNAASYTDNNDGTVTDEDSGLVWQQSDSREDLGVLLDWQGALDYCNGLTLGWADDWRLPNVKELRSIMGPSYEIYFWAHPLYYPYSYWSSTSFSAPNSYGTEDEAWVVGAAEGGLGVAPKGVGSPRVRCVR